MRCTDMDSFQLWWLLVVLPILNIFGALRDAWTALLHAKDGEERRESSGRRRV